MSPSRSLSPVSEFELERKLLRAFVAIAMFAFIKMAAAAAPEVRTPPEVRTDPTQFIVVAVANPVTGRPAAVGGTAHGYGSATNYRVSASAIAVLRDLARAYSLT